MSSNPKVFISHASEDKERFVLRFAERLRGKGIDAWLDKWEMLPGDKLVTKIFNNGLEQSDTVVLVLSNASVKQPWVQKELDTAVVMSIEKKTRLLPIRLDKCEIPLCLKDTLYQEVSDLDNYDNDFERIENAIYRQYDRPPLGEKPPYVDAALMNIGGLAQIDSTILAHACRIAIKQGHADGISAEQIVNDLREREISEAQIMETQAVLENHDYIEVYRVYGPPQVYDFRITHSGFDQFAHAGIPEYRKICADVGRCLVRDVMQNQIHPSKRSIADELDQPPFIVEHIFEMLAANDLIKYSESKCGDRCMDVCWVSPELRRMLESNN